MAAEYLERMGARIRERREELGLTQEDVARQMPGKVNGQRVSLWERGQHRPRDDALEALAGVLDVPVSYFLASPPTTEKTPDLMAAGDPLAGQLNRIETKLDLILTALELRQPDEDPARVLQAFRDAAARAGAVEDPRSTARRAAR